MARPRMLYPQVNVSPWGPGSPFVNIQTSVTTRTWPTANRAYYSPIEIPYPFVVARLWVFNGSAVSGNFDLGLYDRAGRRIVSTGSVAQAGVSQTQEVAVTPVRIEAGSYFLAMAADNTTLAVQAGTADIITRSTGQQMQATAFPLPATAVFATTGGAYFPMMGLASGGFL